MTISDPSNSATRSLSQDLAYAARYYLGSRTGLIAIAAAALGLGLYFNWGWLVAAGMAPIILAAAPCAVMCALGLCMGGRSRSQSDEAASSPGSGVESGAKSSLRLAAAPGEDQNETPASIDPTQTKPRNRKDCC